jgi:hypothetical protein
MRNNSPRTVSLFFFVLLAGRCFAQGPEPAPSFYKLDFALKEVENGKVTNTRTYSMIVSTDKGSPSTSVRTNSKVPMSTAPGQFNYYDVGVNIDCSAIRELPRELALSVTAEITTTQRDASGLGNPVVRSNRWGSRVAVPLKKPTTLFSSDDTVTKGQLQLELTATPILQTP